jgi:hypothetical protein
VKQPRPFVVILLAAAFAGIGLWLGSRTREQSKTPLASPLAPISDAASQISRDAILPDQSPAALIARMFDRLRSGGMAPGELAAFRRALLAAPPSEAIAAIVKFLATGQDAVTGETFSLSAGGELAGAPTFRVTLLDVLGSICRTAGTGDAATVSRGILENKTSADEWAIALRNVAWASPGDTAYLSAKTRDSIRHEPWRLQPSAGFFETFDLIVFTRDVTLIPDLAAMTEGDDPALKGTAATTLDRLSAMAPLEVMNFLNTNPGELAGKPFLRADYFANADLSQPVQRRALETYLARPDVALPEKSKLIARLAAPAQFISDNLVTAPPPSEIPVQQTNGLRAAVGDWLKTRRFPELTGPLLQLQSQLGQ